MTDTPDWEAFGRAIMVDWTEHFDIEAGDKFNLAVKHHILREIPGGFDPEKHVDDYGAEPGDKWYELTPPTPPAPVTVQDAARAWKAAREAAMKNVTPETFTELSKAESALSRALAELKGENQ